MTNATFSGNPMPARCSPRTGNVFRSVVAVLALLVTMTVATEESGAIDPMQLLLIPLGSPAPEFSLPALDDGTRGLSSADLDGGVSLVNVFASWCVPCREEHPVLMSLAEQDLVPIHGLNYKDNPESALRWLERFGNPYGRIGSDLDGRVAEEWGLFGLPQTVVVDKSGRTAFVHTGALDQTVVDETILPLISRLKAEPVTP
jgi:cytochrome c biogenesis protein CcmG/thiol:disulfide interchange protein DsbE